MPPNFNIVLRNSTNNLGVCVNTEKLCRICLDTKKLVNILKMGESNIAKWFENVKAYFNITLSRHDNKSTYLCRKCMKKIEKWRNEQNIAIKNQRIIGFFDEMYQKHVVKSTKQENGQ